VSAAALLGAALAATPGALPVVHDGDDAPTALARAVKATGLPSAQLAPTALDTLLTRPAAVVGRGALRHCAGAPTRGPEVRAFAVRAEAAWRAGDAAAALDQLDLGIAAAGCLAEKVEAPVVARLFLLRAGLLLARDDAAAARAELRAAVALAPTATWDPAWPAAGAALLDDERAAHATCAPTCPSAFGLVQAPAAAAVAPWVDGRPLPAAGTAASPGLHLVQVPGPTGLRSAWLLLDGHATLVVPGSFRRPILEGLATGRGAEVVALVEATLGPGPAYVTAGGGVWLVEPARGTEAVSVLVPPATSASPAEAPKKRR
jgi:hypothetical protein